MKVSDLIAQIQAALPVPVTVRVVELVRIEGLIEGGINVTVYSNGDAGNTVITEHKAADGVEAIIAAHMAARAPKAQKRRRQIENRVHREIFGR